MMVRGYAEASERQERRERHKSAKVARQQRCDRVRRVWDDAVDGAAETLVRDALAVRDALIESAVRDSRSEGLRDGWAGRILRLRDRLATLRAERDALRETLADLTAWAS
jgi:hypothetical protein